MFINFLKNEYYINTYNRETNEFNELNYNICNSILIENISTVNINITNQIILQNITSLCSPFVPCIPLRYHTIVAELWRWENKNSWSDVHGLFS